MTPRAKFWLKVFLLVTLPVWLGPVLLVALLSAAARFFWPMVDALVEDPGSVIRESDE